MDNNEIQIFIQLTFLVVWVMISGIIIYIILYRKQRLLDIKEQEKLKQEHEAELLTTQIEIQNHTMQHIGREIHDNVGQKLTLAGLYTQQLSYKNNDPDILEQVETISSIIDASLSDLRQLSKTLTDDSIAHKTLHILLHGECIKITALKQQQVVYNNNAPALILPYEIKSILLRVVQEFLQNSIKHADCTTLKVLVHKNDTSLQLHLEDDGKGFKVTHETTRGIGLANMKKRAQMIGGTYALQSIANKGTQLNLEIPLH